MIFLFLSGFFRLKGYVAERKGEREEMQDAHVMNDDFWSEVDHVTANVYVNMITYFDNKCVWQAFCYVCN
jgi:hypothetical protein